MAHWIIEDKGFGGQFYTCSNCKEVWSDLFTTDVGTWGKCPKCGAELVEDDIEYVDENPLNKLQKALSNLKVPSIYKNYGYLEGKVMVLKQVSGMTLDELLEKFAAGYVLVPTRMVGVKFDEELAKRHAHDSVDVSRYYPGIFDTYVCPKQGIPKISFEQLNNPPKETIEARDRFFEECDKLDVEVKDGVASIEIEE